MDETVKQDVAEAPGADAEETPEETAPEPPVQESETLVEDTACTAPEEEGGELAQALRECAEERDALKDQLLRAKADFDNYRKRTLRDMERTRKTAAESLFQQLLPVLDNLQRAYQHVDDPDDGLAQGVGMVINQFNDVLADQGVEAIPGVGELFDPNVHEALSQLPSETHPENVIIEEYERGYRLHGYVLRPARVVVSSGPPPAPPDTAEENEAS